MVGFGIALSVIHSFSFLGVCSQVFSYFLIRCARVAVTPLGSNQCRKGASGSLRRVRSEDHSCSLGSFSHPRVSPAEDLEGRRVLCILLATLAEDLKKEQFMILTCVSEQLRDLLLEPADGIWCAGNFGILE